MRADHSATVNILSGRFSSHAAAHSIRQQLVETARHVIDPQAASRVHLHLVDLEKDGAELTAAVDNLVRALIATAPNGEVNIFADEADYAVR